MNLFFLFLIFISIRTPRTPNTTIPWVDYEVTSRLPLIFSFSTFRLGQEQHHLIFFWFFINLLSIPVAFSFQEGNVVFYMFVQRRGFLDETKGNNERTNDGKHTTVWSYKHCDLKTLWTITAPRSCFLFQNLYNSHKRFTNNFALYVHLLPRSPSHPLLSPNLLRDEGSGSKYCWLLLTIAVPILLTVSWYSDLPVTGTKYASRIAGAAKERSQF